MEKNKKSSRPFGHLIWREGTIFSLFLFFFLLVFLYMIVSFFGSETIPKAETKTEIKSEIKNKIIQDSKIQDSKFQDNKFQDIKKSIVGIYEKKIYKNIEQNYFLGNGFFIDSKWYILTNKHLFLHLSSWKKYYIYSQGRELIVINVWLDSQNDLAILKIRSEDTQGLSKISRKSQISSDNENFSKKEVLLVKYNPITKKIEQKKGAILAKKDGNYQTTISGKKWESWSVIVNNTGEVIWMTTFINKKENNSIYAIPLDTKKIERLMQNIIR